MQREIMKAVSIAVAVSVAALAANGQRLDFDRFTADSGLASSFVLQIEQDARGNLWFVTLHGLSRYDGREFRSFGSAEGLIDGRTSALAIAGDGNTYFVGTVSGVSIWDGATVRNLTEADGLGRGSVWSLAIDPTGRVWVGTQAGGLSSIEGNTIRTYTTENGLPSNFVYSLAVDSAGRLWIGTRDAGLAMAEIGADGVPDIRKTWSAAEGLTSPIVRAFHEEPEGSMLVGTRGGGMYRIDRDGALSRVAPQMTGEDVYTIRASRPGGILVGVLGGGVRICSPPAYDRCLTIDATKGLASNAVLSVLEDREGGLWVGTESGVMHLTGHDFLNYGVQEGLSSDFVFAVVPDRDGSLWVTSLNGVSRLEPGGAGTRSRATTWTVRDGLPTNEVWDVLRDDERIWLATSNGLCLFTPGRGCRTFGVEHGLPSRQITSLHTDADGRIWAGTRSGAARLAADVRPDTMRIAEAPVLEGFEVFAMDHEPRGAVWFAMTDAVARLEGGVWTTWHAGAGLGARSVADVLVASDGSVWFGTNDQGLARVDPDHATNGGPLLRLFGTESGLPSLSVRSLVEDGDGMIWASTTRGVVELDPAKAGTHDFVVRQFTIDDGLASQEPTSQHSSARDASGNLWFGFSGGLTRYIDVEGMRPKEMDSAPPVATISTIHAGHERIWAAPFVTMTAPDQGMKRAGSAAPLGERDVSISYSAPVFRGRRTLEYQTRLEGYERDWSAPTSRSTKDYTQLPPGRYTFRLRARAGHGPWSAEATAPIVIPALFWETPWFRAILALAAVALLFTAHRVRTYRMHRHNQELAALVALHTRALEERSRELEETNIELEHTNIELDTINRLLKDADLAKSRFLARMSHELRTPLNSIIGFTDVMQDESREMPPEKRRRFLRNVRHSATILLGLINDILDLSKIEAGKMEVHVEETNVGAVVEEVVETMRVSADERKSHIFVEVDPSLPPVHVDSVKVRQILQNLISNAIKYSDDGATIRVSARRVPVERHGLGVEAFELAVEDDGHGISADQLDGIFDEYRQVRANASSATGTGLGLAIVSRFSELQGGRVTAESTPGKGSTFRVWLPLDARHWDSERG